MKDQVNNQISYKLTPFENQWPTITFNIKYATSRIFQQDNDYYYYAAEILYFIIIHPPSRQSSLGLKPGRSRGHISPYGSASAETAECARRFHAWEQQSKTFSSGKCPG